MEQLRNLNNDLILYIFFLVPTISKVMIMLNPCMRFKNGSMQTVLHRDFPALVKFKPPVRA